MANNSTLLVTFPDYPVNTDTFYGYTTLVGHAGVFLIGSTGLTKYYEFGRYNGNMNGEVRNLSVANVQIGNDGYATTTSLNPVLASLKANAGKNTRIRAAYFLALDYNSMLSQATATQPHYNPLTFNCGKYAEAVILSGSPDISVPTIIIPTPNNIVDEYIEEGYRELLYP